jgi:outer membrane protein assembly factor BamB
MMSPNRALVLAAAVGIAVACAGKPENPKNAAPADKGFVLENVGLATPESVLHDPVADVYLVSNINGNPTADDNNGFISRIAPDGSVQMLKWIEGSTEGVTLNAPKGSAIVGDVLYVADIDVVRKFDCKTGTVLGEVRIPRATFLNDVAAGPDGTVFVTDSGMALGPTGATDTGTASVWRIDRDDAVTALATGPSLMRPNGVLVTPDRGLVFVPFAGSTVMTIAKDGMVKKIAALPGGSLDGVVRVNDGRLLVSSWDASAVFAVDSKGKVTTVFPDLPAPADIGYDAKRNRLLVPLFNDNKVVVKPVPPPSSAS